MVWSLWEGSVGDHIAVKVQKDRANVESANKGREEEIISIFSPLTKNVDSLIILEDISVLLDVAWLNWGKIASDVASVVGLMDGWRVESVVVSWGKVDHHIVQLVTLSLDAFKEGSDGRVVHVFVDFLRRFSGVLGVADVSQEELIESVRAALYTVDCAVLGAHLANRQDATVTWRANRVDIVFVFDDSSTWLKGSCEKVCEVTVHVVSISLGFFNLDTVDF